MMPVVALIKIKTGFVAMANIDQETVIPFPDRNRFRRFVPRQTADGLGQPFLFKNRAVGSLKNTFRRNQILQLLDNDILPGVDTDGQELAHQKALILIDNQSRQTV